MRAVRLLDNSETPQLEVTELATPQPAPDQLLIKVHAAGVIPTELEWYPTRNTKDGEPRVHAIPGHEFSGTVAALGTGAHSFSMGDEIYGMNDWFEQGASAEYCTTLASSVAMKPVTLSHAEAASVPISALTAWQGLFDRAMLKAGERVLIHGGAGAVGAYVVQFAKQHGAEVVATASASNLEFVKSLGAHTVLDYKTASFETLPPVDVIYDAAGGDALIKSLPLLKSGGRAITVASNHEGSDDERIKKAFFIVEPNQKQLIDIGALIDQGKILPFVGAEVSLSQAPAAYTGQVPRPARRGKIVVVID